MAAKSTQKTRKSWNTSTYDFDYERNYFETLTHDAWKEYKTLGNVLDEQITFKGKVTRNTQTNWKWRTMAERWRHAKIIGPTEKPKEVLSEAEGIDFSAIAEQKKEQQHIRKVRGCDKIADTSDLLFDPYSNHMHYSKRMSSVRSVYLPPSMKKVVRNYARKWRIFAAIQSVSARRTLPYNDSLVLRSTHGERGLLNIFPNRRHLSPRQPPGRRNYFKNV